MKFLIIIFNCLNINRETNGNSKSKELNYQPDPEDEVEDLYNLLQDIKVCDLKFLEKIYIIELN